MRKREGKERVWSSYGTNLLLRALSVVPCVINRPSSGTQLIELLLQRLNVAGMRGLLDRHHAIVSDGHSESRLQLVVIQRLEDDEWPPVDATH